MEGDCLRPIDASGGLMEVIEEESEQKSLEKSTIEESDVNTEVEDDDTTREDIRIELSLREASGDDKSTEVARAAKAPPEKEKRKPQDKNEARKEEKPPILAIKPAAPVKVLYCTFPPLTPAHLALTKMVDLHAMGRSHKILPVAPDGYIPNSAVRKLYGPIDTSQQLVPINATKLDIEKILRKSRRVSSTELTDEELLQKSIQHYVADEKMKEVSFVDSVMESPETTVTMAQRINSDEIRRDILEMFYENLDKEFAASKVTTGTKARPRISLRHLKATKREKSISRQLSKRDEESLMYNILNNIANQSWYKPLTDEAISLENVCRTLCELLNTCKKKDVFHEICDAITFIQREITLPPKVNKEMVRFINNLFGSFTGEYLPDLYYTIKNMQKPSTKMDPLTMRRKMKLIKETCRETFGRALRLVGLAKIFGQDDRLMNLELRKFFFQLFPAPGMTQADVDRLTNADLRAMLTSIYKGREYESPDMDETLRGISSALLGTSTSPYTESEAGFLASASGTAGVVTKVSRGVADVSPFAGGLQTAEALKAGSLVKAMTPPTLFEADVGHKYKKTEQAQIWDASSMARLHGREIVKLMKPQDEARLHGVLKATELSQESLEVLKVAEFRRQMRSVDVQQVGQQKKLLEDDLEYKASGIRKLPILHLEHEKKKLPTRILPGEELEFAERRVISLGRGEGTDEERVKIRSKPSSEDQVTFGTEITEYSSGPDDTTAPPSTGTRPVTSVEKALAAAGMKRHGRPEVGRTKSKKKISRVMSDSDLEEMSTMQLKDRVVTPPPVELVKEATVDQVKKIGLISRISSGEREREREKLSPEEPEKKELDSEKYMLEETLKADVEGKMVKKEELLALEKAMSELEKLDEKETVEIMKIKGETPEEVEKVKTIEEEIKEEFLFDIDKEAPVPKVVTGEQVEERKVGKKAAEKQSKEEKEIERAMEEFSRVREDTTVHQPRSLKDQVSKVSSFIVVDDAEFVNIATKQPTFSPSIGTESTLEKSDSDAFGKEVVELIEVGEIAGEPKRDVIVPSLEAQRTVTEPSVLETLTEPPRVPKSVQPSSGIVPEMRVKSPLMQRLPDAEATHAVADNSKLMRTLRSLPNVQGEYQPRNLLLKRLPTYMQPKVAEAMREDGRSPNELSAVAAITERPIPGVAVRQAAVATKKVVDLPGFDDPMFRQQSARALPFLPTPQHPASIPTTPDRATDRLPTVSARIPIKRAPVIPPNPPCIRPSYVSPHDWGRISISRAAWQSGKYKFTSNADPNRHCEFEEWAAKGFQDYGISIGRHLVRKDLVKMISASIHESGV